MPAADDLAAAAMDLGASLPGRLAGECDGELGLGALKPAYRPTTGPTQAGAGPPAGGDAAARTDQSPDLVRGGQPRVGLAGEQCRVVVGLLPFGREEQDRADRDGRD